MSAAGGGHPAHNAGMMQFDGEARLRYDRTQRNMGALRREGFQPARRHPSAARRYQQRAHTDDELDNELDGPHRQRSFEQIGGVRSEYSNEMRREYSNECVGQREQHDSSKAHRSLSAPPVRIGAVIPHGNSDQVLCRPHHTPLPSPHCKHRFFQNSVHPPLRCCCSDIFLCCSADYQSEL